MNAPGNRLGFGLVMGAAVGTVVGLANGSLAPWLAIGVVSGLAWGAVMSRRQPPSDRVPEQGTEHGNHEER